MVPVGLGVEEVVERVDRRIEQAEAAQAEQKCNKRAAVESHRVIRLRRLHRKRHRQQHEHILDPVLRARQSDQAAQQGNHASDRCVVRRLDRLWR